MDEAEGRRVATDPLALVQHPAHLLHERLGRGVREDPVGETRGAADGGLGAAADEDGDPRRGRRPDGERREVVDSAPVGERLARPCLREDPEDLVHGRAATTGIGAEPGELDLRPAKPETQHQPAVAEQLDGRRVLGQAERVVHRREDDARAELDPGRRLGDRGADHEERRHVPVIDEVVFGRPDGREAEPLRLDGEAHRLVVGARPVGLARAKLCAEESEAESHGCGR